MNRYQVSKIALTREVIDCIVFWTKNPKQMIPYLNYLNENKYIYYFQFTLNPYGKDLEPNIPAKKEVIKTFKELSGLIGKKRVIWRYDPIILTDELTIDYHLKYFEYLADHLKGYTDKCIISFLDLYKKCQRNLNSINLSEVDNMTKRKISKTFYEIAEQRGLTIETCAEDIELKDLGIPHGKCIDDRLIGELCGAEVDLDKDKTQRDACGCISSIDIGAYNTCQHCCLYCYANFNHDLVKRNSRLHNPDSPFLIGDSEDKDKISKRKMKSCLLFQNKLFKEFQG